MDDAVSARQQLEAERAAQAAAEEQAAREAIEAARKEAEEQETNSDNQTPTFTTNSGTTTEVKVPENTNSGTVEWSEKDNFVNNWTPRIDAYLAGSPLAGHGRVGLRRRPEVLACHQLHRELKGRRVLPSPQRLGLGQRQLA